MRRLIKGGLAVGAVLVVVEFVWPNPALGNGDDSGQDDYTRLRTRVDELERVVGAPQRDRTREPLAERIGQLERSVGELRSRFNATRSQAQFRNTDDIQRAARALEAKQNELYRRLDGFQTDLRDVSSFSRDISDVRRELSSLQSSLDRLSSRVDRLERQ